MSPFLSGFFPEMSHMRLAYDFMVHSWRKAYRSIIVFFSGLRIKICKKKRYRYLKSISSEKKNYTSFSVYMLHYHVLMDYIRNSKNRKLKTQILTFFARVQFGTYRFGFSGKALMFANVWLLISLFFPWLYFWWEETNLVSYSAFSLYLWGVGYGIIFAVFLIAFFLLSHEKKEYLRAYVPFRLSDAQAIVFLSAMILVASIHAIITSFAYTRMSSQPVNPGFGLELSIVSLLLLILFAYFFSQSEKSRAVSMSYLEKKDPNYIDEYSAILESKSRPHSHTEEDKNMTLPI